MNKKNNVAAILLIAAILIAVYLYMDGQEDKKRIEELEAEKFNRLYDSMNPDDVVSEEIKRQISSLILRFSKLDHDVAQELARAMSLLQLNQKEKAIESLAKIMEHLLKKLYMNNAAWKNWMEEKNKNPSKPHIHDLLSYCFKIDKRLETSEYQFYMAVKEVRNREAHDVNYKIEKNLSDAGLLAAISGIIRIQDILQMEKELEITVSQLNGIDHPKQKSEQIQDGIIRDAKLSQCRTYRYALSRIWNTEKPKVLFVMLNPSKANAQEDDPTIRRCIGYAKSWNYGGLFVTNLFAYVNKDPETLIKAVDPVGVEKTKYLKKYMNKVDKVVCAWGNRSVLKKLGYKSLEDELTLLNYSGDKLHYLELSIDGTPKHPGRLKKGLVPSKFEIFKEINIIA